MSQDENDMAKHTVSPCVKVTVGTGSSQRTHFIHRTLLESKSEFFRACLSGDFAESLTGEISLPDDDDETFSHLVRYFYGGEMRMDDFGETDKGIVEAYILGDKLLCVDFKNIMVDMLQHFYCFHLTIRPQSLQPFASRGITNNKMMDYMVIQCGYELAHRYGAFMHKDRWNAFFELGSEIDKAMMDHMNDFRTCKKHTSDPALWGNCQFHEHDSGTTGCKRWTAPDQGTNTGGSSTS